MINKKVLKTIGFILPIVAIPTVFYCIHQNTTPTRDLIINSQKFNDFPENINQTSLKKLNQAGIFTVIKTDPINHANLVYKIDSEGIKRYFILDKHFTIINLAVAKYHNLMTNVDFQYHDKDSFSIIFNDGLKQKVIFKANHLSPIKLANGIAQDSANHALLTYYQGEDGKYYYYIFTKNGTMVSLANFQYHALMLNIDFQYHDKDSFSIIFNDGLKQKVIFKATTATKPELYISIAKNVQSGVVLVYQKDLKQQYHYSILGKDRRLSSLDNSGYHALMTNVSINYTNKNLFNIQFNDRLSKKIILKRNAQTKVRIYQYVTKDSSTGAILTYYQGSGGGYYYYILAKNGSVISLYDTGYYFAMTNVDFRYIAKDSFSISFNDGVVKKIILQNKSLNQPRLYQTIITDSKKAISLMCFEDSSGQYHYSFWDKKNYLFSLDKSQYHGLMSDINLTYTSKDWYYIAFKDQGMKKFIIKASALDPVELYQSLIEDPNSGAYLLYYQDSNKQYHYSILGKSKNLISLKDLKYYSPMLDPVLYYGSKNSFGISFKNGLSQKIIMKKDRNSKIMFYTYRAKDLKSGAFLVYHKGSAGYHYFYILTKNGTIISLYDTAYYYTMSDVTFKYNNKNSYYILFTRKSIRKSFIKASKDDSVPDIYTNVIKDAKSGAILVFHKGANNTYNYSFLEKDGTLTSLKTTNYHSKMTGVWINYSNKNLFSIVFNDGLKRRIIMKRNSHSVAQVYVFFTKNADGNAALAYVRDSGGGYYYYILDSKGTITSLYDTKYYFKMTDVKFSYDSKNLFSISFNDGAVKKLIIKKGAQNPIEILISH